MEGDNQGRAGAWREEVLQVDGSCWGELSRGWSSALRDLSPPPRGKPLSQQLNIFVPMKPKGAPSTPSHCPGFQSKEPWPLGICRQAVSQAGRKECPGGQSLSPVRSSWPVVNSDQRKGGSRLHTYRDPSSWVLGVKLPAQGQAGEGRKPAGAHSFAR